MVHRRRLSCLCIRVVPIVILVLVFLVMESIDISYRVKSRSSPEAPVPYIEPAVAEEPDIDYGDIQETSGTWNETPWKPVILDWFRQCQHSLQPVDIKEKLHNRRCPNDCSGVGVCNSELGECRCRSGYNGSDCTGFDDHPCNLDPFIPDVPARWIVSICPAVCDNRTAQCYCGPDSKHPHRPLVDPCGFSSKEGGLFFTEDDRKFLYGNESKNMGWCNADVSEVLSRQQRLAGTCHCTVDGRSGFLCEDYNRAYCPGGCNNHGDCFSGYCHCKDNWYGMDCSIPSASTTVRNDTYIPPWMEADRGKDASHAGSRSGEENVFRRKRPLIYIYDLPGDNTFHHYEGRQILQYCVPWMYNPNNDTQFNSANLYGMEPVVLEALLASPHRTTNGDEADFFYVPTLTGCILVRADDSPRVDMTYTFDSCRPYLTTRYANQTLDYIRSNFPFWNRSHGKDHIWMYPWDEGACYAPAVIWNSTMLSPWGNTMTKHRGSTTAYSYDDWSRIPFSIRGDHPCFDPAKDIVIPAWKPPNPFLVHLWERPYTLRKNLFFFNGQMGPGMPNGRPEEGYSMGIRQKVAKYFSSIENNQGSIGLYSEEGVIVSSQRSGMYSEELASSRFCGVFPGDGFSARMEDSILHGCIPVIIQDGIQLAWENVLDYDTFAIRIAENDIPNMIKILKRVNETRIEAMWSTIKKIWQRWTYHSVTALEYSRQMAWYDHRPEWGTQNENLKDDDAIATLIQVLHYKLYNDPWRKTFKRPKATGLHKKCRGH